MYSQYDSQGRLIKLERDDASYKVFLNYYEGTSQAGLIEEYSASGTQIDSCEIEDPRAYEYYEDGRVKSKDILLADGIAQQIVFDFKEDQLRGLNFGENSETPSPKAFTDFVDTVKSTSQK